MVEQHKYPKEQESYTSMNQLKRMAFWFLVVTTVFVWGLFLGGFKF